MCAPDTSSLLTLGGAESLAGVGPASLVLSPGSGDWSSISAVVLGAVSMCSGSQLVVLLGARQMLAGGKVAGIGVIAE